MKNCLGFTLIETSIVVAVIGILTSLAIPSFQKMRNLSLNQVKKSNVRILNQAATVWSTELLIPDGTPISLEITNYIQGGISQLDVGNQTVNLTNITQKTVGYVFTVEDLY